jgi:RNA polymerase sigma-70 factor (ECF subfamily)
MMKHLMESSAEHPLTDAVADDAAAESSAEQSFIEPPPAEAVLFEEIVERYHGKVFQLVYRYIGDYDEACDLTQDTFVRAYGAWREFRGESQIYTWLYRIAINLCHNQQKKLQRRRRVECVSLDSAPAENGSGSGAAHGPMWSSREVADERPLPPQTLESHELRVRLHEALRELPDNYRTVIVLRDIEGLTYEEIARITDSTLEAIKSRLFRARGAIRRLMEPYLLAEPTRPETETFSSAQNDGAIHSTPSRNSPRRAAAPSQIRP